MEIPTYLFAICVSLLSGDGTDCSYQFQQVDDEALNIMYNSYTGITASKYLNGFVTHKDKIMFLENGVSSRTIIHEINHIKCKLEYKETGINHKFCVDLSIDYEMKYNKPNHFIYNMDIPDKLIPVMPMPPMPDALR
jgi:hypothetical protein